jgi:hypothetical protein
LPNQVTTLRKQGRFFSCSGNCDRKVEEGKARDAFTRPHKEINASRDLRTRQHQGPELRHATA